MNKLIARIVTLLDRYKRIIRYLMNSCLVTIVDISVVWLLHYIFQINLIVANTCGVVIGTMIGYYLTSKFVFEGAKGSKGIIVYLLTFVLGLLLANSLIYLGDNILFIKLGEQWRFLFSKGISIVGPFFILYGIRKKLYTQ